MNNALTCCPGRPAHPSRRSFFKAAAALALAAGSLTGALGTQAYATDYTNPVGNTEYGSQQFDFHNPIANFTNAGILDVTNNLSATALFGGVSLNNFVNSGLIHSWEYGVNLDCGYQSFYPAPNIGVNIVSLVNSGTISAEGCGIGADSFVNIGTLSNTGAISAVRNVSRNVWGGDATAIDTWAIITTLNNSGTISSTEVAIMNGGTITTLNNSNSITGGSQAIVNYGTITTLINSGAIIGDVLNNGTIDAINNTGSMTAVTNSSTITTLNNRGTITTLTNSGTIGSFNGDNGGTVTSFINNGFVNNANGNGISLSTSHITTLTNNGTIAGDWVILLNLGSSITTLNNYGDITGATDGINNQGWVGNVNTITTLNNTGTISGASRFGVCSYGVITTLVNSGTISGQYCGIVNGGTITTLTNSGTITGNLGEAISNQGTIGTLNLLTNSVLNGQISNYGGTIGTLNLYKDIASGDFDSSSIDVAIYGNQPGVTNRYATVNSGTTVGTFTNSVAVNTLDNAGTITTLSNASTIMTLTNSGTIGTLTLLSGSSITNSIQNSGSIGTLNLYKTIASGDFNTSSIVAAITGNQPGTINRYASINTGSTVGTLTNAISLRGLTNAGTTAAVNNTGTITLLTNSGTITTLTNSGTIGSVANSGTIGTLNLLGGSTVTSGINNTGTINVLNLTVTGVTCSNYDLVVPGITGNQPLTVNFLGLPTDDHSVSVTNNGRRASVDVSGFGANNDAIRHVSNSVANLANTNGAIQAIGAKAAKHAAEPYTLTTDLCADGAPAPADQIGNSDLWIRGFMGRNKVDATASSVDYINTYSGGAVGYERDWSDDLRAGAFLGAGKMKNSLGSSLGSTDSNLLFAGAFATKTWGTSFAKVGLTGGRGNNTSKRNIAGATPETATADYHSWYVSPEVNVGKVYPLGQHLGGDISVTPVASVRYVYANQGGYTETGATNNLTMNSSHSTTFEERVELKLSYETKALTGYDVKLNASVGGIGQQNNGDAMSGTLLGSPLSFATPGQSNTTGFVGGLGFEVNRGRYTFTASGDYVRLSGGNADLSANVVLHMKF